MSEEKTSPFGAIFAAGDPFGLLAVKASGPTRSSRDEIAIKNFEAINAFIDEHGFLPGLLSNDREPALSEYTLEAFLETFRGEEGYRSLLAPFDRHNLLGIAVARTGTPRSMEEIIADDDPLLRSPADPIFELRHVKGPTPKSRADDIAQRRPCTDFATYAPIFAALALDLKSGRRVTKRFEREGSIRPGAAFILNGITAYIADVNTPHRRGKETDARLRVIFENGTESNHLLRSFARVLYEDDNGRQIIESAPTVSGPLFAGGEPMSGPLFTGEVERKNADDRYTGSIYVVESLSSDPSIAALRGRLYKIGFTTQDVRQRLANVEADPTFLFAPVHIVAIFETVNVNSRKLEGLLHQFFGYAQLQIDIALGRTVNPKEWFVVPVEFIREAISRIIDGTIINYRYDHISRKIVER